MGLKKQTIINTVGNLVYLTGLWFLTVITTRILGYVDAGILNLAISIVNLFLIIQLFGVRSFQCSDISYRYSSSEYFFTRLLTSMVGLLLLIGFLFINQYSWRTFISAFLFAVFRTFESISDVFYGEYQRMGRLDLAGSSTMVRGIISVSIFSGIMIQTKSLICSLLAISFASLAHTTIFDLILCRKYISIFAWKECDCKKILIECFPLCMASLLPAIINTIPRIILEKYYGVEVVGYFGNISTPSAIITTIIPSVLTALVPVFSNYALKNDYMQIRRLWLKTIVGTLIFLAVCIIGTILIGEKILALIYTVDIKPYIRYLYFILVSTSLYAITMCSNTVLVSLRKNKAIGACSAGATMLCLLVAIPIIKEMAIMGVIVVMILSYLLQILTQVTVVIKATS